MGLSFSDGGGTVEGIFGLDRHIIKLQGVVIVITQHV